MRLLKWNGGDVCLIDVADDPPPYAILSHTWGPAETEVIYRDLRNNTAKNRPGYDKIEFCGIQAKHDQLEYFWVDTCCIDKDSSAELQESLNSMFKWYRNSQQCYVYLSDVSKAEQQPSLAPAIISWETAFQSSKWFTRGWTLQELIAPKSVAFFSKESEYLGDKKTLESLIHGTTGIPFEVLRGSRPLSEFSDNDRFAWMQKRKTTRPEDEAYALLGIFDVFVPLMYGQGEEKVFDKLMEEIERGRIRNISIIDADNYLHDDYYDDTRLRIERLSGKKLAMEHCYINLAIIERVPEKTARSAEGDPSRTPSPFELFHRLKVNEPAPNIRVKLSQLFGSRQDSYGGTIPVKRIVIRGRAGVGKTTLCKRIVFDFKRRELWGHLFDRILWVPLRSLKNWTSDRYNLREFLHHHFYRHHPFGQDLAERLERTIGSSEQQGENRRILFLLDGLDEVSQTWDPGHPKHDFLVMLLNQPSVIITSRPHAQIPQDVDRSIDLELETIGFYPDQVVDYLGMAFQDADEVIQVHDIFRKYPIIQGLVRIPILLDAFCYNWDVFSLSGNRAAPQTMTAFYQAIVGNLLRKDIVRLGKVHDGQVVTSTIAATLLPLQLNQIAKMELHLLENLAFAGMVHNMIDFAPRIRDAVLRRSESLDGIVLPDQSLRHLSFLRTSDPSQNSQDVSYHFLHLTFQELFAARYFVRQWISGGYLDLTDIIVKKANSQTIQPIGFLTQYKYETRYDIFWRFVAGLLDERDSKQNIRFFRAIQDRQSRDLLGPAHQRLIMHCLSEISVQKELRADLEMTLEQWLVFEIELRGFSYLARAVEFPDRIVLNVLNNRKSTMARAVLYALSDRPNLPNGFLRPILARLDDPNKLVQSAAARALGSRTDDLQVRQALLARLKDPDNHVRGAAVEALGSRIDDLQVRQALLARLEDPDNHVRSTAVRELVSRTDDLQVRQALLTQLKDPDNYVRSVTARKLGSRTDDLQVRQALLARLEDPDNNVRSAAVEALVSRTDDLQVRQALLTRLEDPDDYVQTVAVIALVSRTDDLQVRQALLARLGDPDDHVRNIATRELGSQTDNLQVRQALLTRLEDPNNYIRSTAVEELGSRTDDLQVRQALLARLEDPDNYVRGTAVIALGSRTDDLQVRQALLARLEDPERIVQHAAAEVLLRYKHNGFDMSNKRRTQILYTILLQRSFEEQFCWQLQSGTSCLTTPWGVVETIIKDDKQLAKMIKQARPANYPTNNDRKEERWFNLRRDKIPLIRSIRRLNQ